MERRAQSRPVRALESHYQHQVERVPAAPVIRIDRAAAKVGGRTVWQDVTLDVFPGEFIAILGPNGSGKSTLLKSILGLVPLAAGTISVAGGTPRAGRRLVGYTPQRRSFNADVHVRGRDVVRLGLDGTRWGIPLPHLPGGRGGRRQHETRARVQAVIDMVGAAAYADRPIGELSGGEQQRLLIAEALVTSPCVLLLDEPLDGLDLHHQQEVSAVIRQIGQEHQAAVLLVAHDVNPLLQHVDRVAYIVNGRITVGKAEEVITSETLSQLYGSPVEVLHTRDGRLVVVGQPEGVPCTDYHTHSH